MIEFFDRYDLMKCLDLQKRYNTVASQFYRKKMSAQALNQSFSDPDPLYEEGRTLPDGSKI